MSAGTFTPWRVLITGLLADIVESDLVDELAPGAEAAAADWVKPGPAVWSWWSDHCSGSQPASQRRFVDFAAELGWRHILVDCGWVDDWVPSLVSYARVGVGRRGPEGRLHGVGIKRAIPLVRGHHRRGTPRRTDGKPAWERDPPRLGAPVAAHLAAGVLDIPLEHMIASMPVAHSLR